MPIGATEALIIAGAIVLLFGASRLPQLMGALGKSIKEFKRAVSEDDEPPKRSEERKAQEKPREDHGKQDE